ncbi:aldehyde dehydrogenase family protein [Sphingobium sufflavum]|uniref:aldehyde dehydrogenase family protein n=1 Tax=Sphingobium sufflavum TaxID=1129547 RepID=UPI001F43EB09|nr:aldehyde dehydrogenase family protein [Sphingobium sufflavum]MCE7795437.1 aldehyde dehydrogenase family protein [Sphingobium sufflavum]
MEGVLDYAGYIDGAFVKGAGAILTVENPSDESIVASFPGLSAEQTQDAIRVARAAFDSGAWSDLSMAERAVYLRRYTQALASRADRLIEYAVAEGGCPRSSSVMYAQAATPLRQAEEIIDLFLSLPEFEDNHLPLSERIGPMGGTVQSIRRYTPIGVVTGIAANNVPFYTAMWKVIPALLAGNTVILRPNPLTPLSAIIFAEAAEEAGLPKGVFNLVIEAGLEGATLLTTDPAIDLVAFTGSSAVGAAVMAQAAPTMKRLQLELGGHSAQIFLPDSVDKAVAQARIICVSHAGQGCALGKRIFVPEDQKAALLEKIAADIATIRIGVADDPQTQLGPVISAGQRAACERHVQRAVDAGARVVIGGKRPDGIDKGYFFEPTILDLPDNSNPGGQDEIFGPIAAIIGYRDLDHAVQMANDSRYGLSGYVHGVDKKAALAVGLRIKSGTVHVNAVLSSSHASFGGQRLSGLGRERGADGLRTYQQLSCLTIG